MDKKETELNENDKKLIALCWYQRRTISDIARELKITQPSISARIDRLKQAGLIKTEESTDKRKVWVRATQGDKTQEYFYEILQALQDRGGELSEEEYLNLIPYILGENDTPDKFHAPLTLMYMQPNLIERRIRLTEEGRRFIKQHKSRKK